MQNKAPWSLCELPYIIAIDVCRSGTEEEYNERDQLLQDILSLIQGSSYKVRSAKKSSKVCSGDSNVQARKSAAAARDVHANRYAERSTVFIDECDTADDEFDIASKCPFRGCYFSRYRKCNRFLSYMRAAYCTQMRSCVLCLQAPLVTQRRRSCSLAWCLRMTTTENGKTTSAKVR